MSEDNSTPSISPFVKKEIPPTEPITFFGQKKLPTPERTVQDFYEDYDVVMERVDEAAADAAEKRAEVWRNG